MSMNIEQFIEKHVTENKEEASRELFRFLRDEKVASSRSFAKLVGEMRRKQRDYFKTKADYDLREAKTLEQRVDRSIEAISKYK